VPHAVPYDLRHTYASLRLAEQRLSLQAIAEKMGHSVQVLARPMRTSSPSCAARARSSPTS
jgi:integrase